MGNGPDLQKFMMWFFCAFFGTNIYLFLKKVMKITIINKVFCGANYMTKLLHSDLSALMSYMKAKNKFLRKNSETTCVGPILIFMPKNTEIQVYSLIFFLNIEIDEYNSHGEIFT